MWFVKQHTYRIHTDKYRLCLAPNLLLQLICYAHYFYCRCSSPTTNAICHVRLVTYQRPSLVFPWANSIIRRTRTRNEEEMNIRSESFPLRCCVWLYPLGSGLTRWWCIAGACLLCEIIAKKCVKDIVGWLMSFSLDLCPDVNKHSYTQWFSTFWSLIQLLARQDNKSYKGFTYTNTFTYVMKPYFIYFQNEKH